MNYTQSHRHTRAHAAVDEMWNETNCWYHKHTYTRRKNTKMIKKKKMKNWNIIKKKAVENKLCDISSLLWNVHCVHMYSLCVCACIIGCLNRVSVESLPVSTCMPTKCLTLSRGIIMNGIKCVRHTNTHSHSHTSARKTHLLKNHAHRISVKKKKIWIKQTKMWATSNLETLFYNSQSMLLFLFLFHLSSSLHFRWTLRIIAFFSLLDRGRVSNMAIAKWHHHPNSSLNIVWIAFGTSQK